MQSETVRAVGYARVSTPEQAKTGAGLAAQREAILRECERRGWELVDVVEDRGYSARDLRRPGIQSALEMLRRGDAKVLVVSKLDRASRSLLDFAALMATAERQSWALVALDVAVDTSTPAGEAMANVLATFAQFERRLIGQRTKEGLAAKRADGTLKGPVGRPPSLPPVVVRTIKRRRGAGWSLSRIADTLNKDQVPTAQGGRMWHPSTVRAILERADRTSAGHGTPAKSGREMR
jgi:DNA invertase Pin-like site-specific DNA recombinase